MSFTYFGTVVFQEILQSDASPKTGIPSFWGAISPFTHQSTQRPVKQKSTVTCLIIYYIYISTLTVSGEGHSIKSLSIIKDTLLRITPATEDNPSLSFKQTFDTGIMYHKVTMTSEAHRVKEPVAFQDRKSGRSKKWAAFFQQLSFKFWRKDKRNTVCANESLISEE